MEIFFFLNRSDDIEAFVVALVIHCIALRISCESSLVKSWNVPSTHPECQKKKKSFFSDSVFLNQGGKTISVSLCLWSSQTFSHPKINYLANIKFPQLQLNKNFVWKCFFCPRHVTEVHPSLDTKWLYCCMYDGWNPGKLLTIITCTVASACEEKPPVFWGPPPSYFGKAFFF